MQLKRCAQQDHEGTRFLPIAKFHKRGRRNGEQYYDSYCKECRNGLNRAEYSISKKISGGWPVEKKKAYMRARSRALTKLTKLVPELWERLLHEEMATEPEFKDYKWT